MDLAELALALPDGVEVAELHGLICGLACAEPHAEPALRLRCLAALLGDDHQLAPWLQDSGEAEALSADQPLHAFIQAGELALAEADLGFTPLLPDDEAALQDRIWALADWCSGFMAGYGALVEQSALSPMAAEILRDLARIAEVDADAELADAEAEGAEADFVELVEYLRAAVLNLRWASEEDA